MICTSPALRQPRNIIWTQPHCFTAGAAVELRFEGSEELGYDPLGTPPRGEICLRGPIIFQGYYQDKKKTDEAFGEQHSSFSCPQSLAKFFSAAVLEQQNDWQALWRAHH